MGEMAEYILNGDDCQVCGEYIGEGDGYPRSCSSCVKEDEEEPAKDLKNTGQKMGKKMRRALQYPKDCQGGMYPGCHWDLAPSMLARLAKWGFVETYQPHNLVHKTRCILTPKGEAAYKEIKAGRPVYLN